MKTTTELVKRPQYELQCLGLSEEMEARLDTDADFRLEILKQGDLYTMQGIILKSKAVYYMDKHEQKMPEFAKRMYNIWRSVGAGTLLPELAAKYITMPGLLTRLMKFEKQEQQRIVNQEPIKVLVWSEAQGAWTDDKLVAADELVLDKDDYHAVSEKGFRGVEEQKRILMKTKRGSRTPIKLRGNEAIEVRRVRGEAIAHIQEGDYDLRTILELLAKMT